MIAPKWFTAILIVVLLNIPPFMLPMVSGMTDPYSIEYDSNHYTDKTLTVNDQTINYRAYENIVYVKNPVDTKYQSMNVYVPRGYYEGKSIGNYTAETAPIFLPNMVGGYMPGAPGSPGQDRETGGPDAIFIALSKGYVVAAPGARGRTTQGDKGQYTGKAPAAIIDLKAAVRYLRHNDKAMPGDAEKIISNGTSAGGALSSLLGATGNNKDYEPYLKELGAADERDDIFAVSAYCPITNLENADMAYEWQFNGINDYKKVVITMTGGQMKRSDSQGVMAADQIKYSDELKAMFQAYLNALNLKKTDGTKLTLDVNGNGTFKEYIKSFVIISAQKALDSGKDLSALTWITIKDRTVTDIDFDKYIAYQTRAKATPAFDGVDLSTPENDEFGSQSIKGQHFTQFGKDYSTVGGSLADAAVVKLMNPMNYIGTEATSIAKYWRIRHGTVDRDTSLAIPAILATKLINNGFDVDFALSWDRPHSGDYDLDELFNWIGKVCDTLATPSAIPASTNSTPMSRRMVAVALLGLLLLTILLWRKSGKRK